jgi:MFS family permease
MSDFFASLYELIGYTEDFNSYLYDAELYLFLGIILIVSSVLLPIIYYYVINHPNYNRWWHWMIMVIVNAVINFVVALIVVNNELTAQAMESEFVTEMITFSFLNAMWAFFAVLIFSNVVRWKSTNASQTPYPL